MPATQAGKFYVVTHFASENLKKLGMWIRSVGRASSRADPNLHRESAMAREDARPTQQRKSTREKTILSDLKLQRCFNGVTNDTAPTIAR
jgi:hypothetical protein